MDKKHSKSGVFLIELLIIITVFAVCSAICVKVMATAHTELTYSERLTAATNIACDIAERFKAGENAVGIAGDDLTKGYPQSNGATLTARLLENKKDGIQYLTVVVSDEENEYTSITAARIGEQI